MKLSGNRQPRPMREVLPPVRERKAIPKEEAQLTGLEKERLRQEIERGSR